MLNDAEQRIVAHVEKFGWSAMSVAPGVDSDEEDDEWFTYTIGLPNSRSWPELVCFGLDGKTAHGILTDAIAEMSERGVRPEAGLLLHKTLNGQDAMLVEGTAVPDPYLGSAIWFSRHSGFPCPPPKLQLVWPDEEGRFPSDPECDPEVRQLQTPLGLK